MYFSASYQPNNRLEPSQGWHHQLGNPAPITEYIPAVFYSGLQWENVVCVCSYQREMQNKKHTKINLYLWQPFSVFVIFPLSLKRPFSVEDHVEQNYKKVTGNLIGKKNSEEPGMASGVKQDDVDEMERSRGLLFPMSTLSI